MAVILSCAAASSLLGWYFALPLQQGWADLWLYHLAPRHVGLVKVGGFYPSGYWYIRFWSAVVGLAFGGCLAWALQRNGTAKEKRRFRSWPVMGVVLLTTMAMCYQGWSTRAELAMRIAQDVDSQWISGANTYTTSKGEVLIIQGISSYTCSDKNMLSFGRVALAMGGFCISLLAWGWRGQTTVSVTETGGSENE